VSKFVTAVIAAFGATSIAVAPIAVAEPVAVNPSASSTIDELEAQGYDVQINWMNGSRSDALSECSVTAVHNPNRSGEPPATFTTVYIDVLCPEHHDGDFGIFGGLGGFF
jgi:hypothetical protein